MCRLIKGNKLGRSWILARTGSIINRMNTPNYFNRGVLTGHNNAGQVRTAIMISFFSPVSGTKAHLP
ncbi:hypothetical protein SCFA_860001 [anaerobic digester metagenome]|uniref:Uncharacterized protein n=1 Tax=anaerobic digester metagenome TaxID=1263854 RepID=A0A485LV57_9ZZZZ